ncbi:hypothetical protein ACFQ60_08600 [Streptomyces zhihengii]
MGLPVRHAARRAGLRRAALPVRGPDGGIADFLIRAGNHVRSAEWLPSPTSRSDGSSPRPGRASRRAA